MLPCRQRSETHATIQTVPPVDVYHCRYFGCKCTFIDADLRKPDNSGPLPICHDDCPGRRAAPVASVAPTLQHAWPLGDQVEAALTRIGITKERVSEWLGHPCNCPEQQAKLNQLGDWAAKTVGNVFNFWAAKSHIESMMSPPSTSGTSQSTASQRDSHDLTK